MPKAGLDGDFPRGLEVVFVGVSAVVVLDRSPTGLDVAAPGLTSAAGADQGKTSASAAGSTRRVTTPPAVSQIFGFATCA